MKVLLIANYVYDRQESMTRFSDILFHELVQHGVDVEMIRPEPFFGRLRPSGTGLGKWLGYIDKFVIFPFALKRRLASMKHVVVHICDHSNAHYTRYLKNVPHVASCHDLLAVRSALGAFPQNRTGFTGRILQKLILNGLKRAQRITCISQATLQDVLRLVQSDPHRVTFVSLGLNYPYSPMPRTEAATRVRTLNGTLPETPFILHVGGNQWYKNRLGVLKIFAAFRAENPTRNTPILVMVGPPQTKAMREFLACNPQIAGEVIPLKNVNNEDLRALYSMAELVLFPSLAEGFGWPILEAQACGCRVITTGREPMTEVGGTAAFYLEPGMESDDRPKRAASVLQQVLAQDSRARQAAVAASLTNAQRFSTATMIRGYLQLYRDLLPVE